VPTFSRGSHAPVFASAGELAAQLEQMGSTARNVRTEAAGLERLVSRFVLGDGGPAPALARAELAVA
jgi:hypothetical protein